MKALVIHAPGEYKVESDWPKPAVKPGWALVKVEHAGVCGSDVVRFGKTGSYHHPMILGHEFSGIVEAPAPGSNKFKEGDRVAVLPLVPCGVCPACTRGESFHCSNYLFLGSRIDGGYAEYCLAPEENLFPLPENTDVRAGAFIEPMSVALHVVRRSGFSDGGSALVLGAGTIGLLIGLWLKVFKASRVVITDIRPESLAIAKDLGFAEALEVKDIEKELKENDEKFDAVFEAAGSNSALLTALQQTKDKGSVTVVGRDTVDTVIPLEIFEQFMRKEISMHGCWGYDLKGEETFLYERLKDGSIPLAPMITQEIALEESPDLITSMIKKEKYYCKALIKM